MKKKQYRYPGTQPYEYKDRELFFGREEDIERLSQLIVLEKLVVLVGRSGVGKTSLLNAGVIPKLGSEEQHVVLKIYFSEQASSPLDLLLGRLKSEVEENNFLTEKFNISRELPNDITANLWYYAKIIQIYHPHAEAMTLVFDHFEELFNFPPTEVDDFSKSIADLLNFRSPTSVRHLLMQKLETDENFLDKKQIKKLLRPLNLKVVLSVRNDYMGELDKLKKFLPEVFTYTYELLPLAEIQCLIALRRPAALKPEKVKLKSPEFFYAKETIDIIFKNLKDKNNRIETFMLQLIGQHAEQSIIEKKGYKEKITKFKIKIKTSLQKLIGVNTSNKLLGRNSNPPATKFIVKKGDLGNPKYIFENHYNEIITGLPSFRRRSARNLIETKLIKRRKREAIAENKLTTKGGTHSFFSGRIPKSSLEKLENKLLVRASNTPGRDGHPYYELSHDAMVEPILMSRARRRKEEVIAWFYTIGILALLLGFILGGYNQQPPQPPDEGKSLLDLEFVISPCSPAKKFPVEIFANYADKNGKKKCEECKIEIIKIIELDSIIIKPKRNNYYELSKGKYSISATDSVGGITKDDFTIPHCESTLSADYLPLKTPDSSITVNILVNKIIGPLIFDSTILSAEIKPLGIKMAEVKKEKSWFPKLREIKKGMKDETCEGSKVRNWHFNDNEAHLIGIRITTHSALNQTHDSLLLVLVIADSVFPYKSITPKLKRECMLGSQKRYDLRASLQRESLYKDSLALVSKRFENPAGDAIVSMQENIHNDPYEIFAAKIRKEKPKMDEIYYTFLDEEYFDINDRKEIEKVFDDPKTEYLYLPSEM